jgi:hypothetical protein
LLIPCCVFSGRRCVCIRRSRRWTYGPTRAFPKGEGWQQRPGTNGKWPPMFFLSTAITIRSHHCFNPSMCSVKKSPINSRQWPPTGPGPCLAANQQSFQPLFLMQECPSFPVRLFLPPCFSKALSPTRPPGLGRASPSIDCFAAASPILISRFLHQKGVGAIATTG